MNKNNIWFTSDTHFGHTNILKYSKRPFDDVHHMNEELIKRWNEKVQPDDSVYFLGDMFLCTYEKAEEIIHRLNGRIFFIQGNHDKIAFNLKQYFEWYKDYAEVMMPDGQRITLCHYAMRVWNKSHHGSMHIYGHSHGSLPDDPNARSMDCGTDTNNYYPYSYEEIKKILQAKTFIPVDHHGEKR